MSPRARREVLAVDPEPESVSGEGGDPGERVVDAAASSGAEEAEEVKEIATAQMAPKTQDFLVDDTHFWVVRPRISGATVSGLGTLISGAYVGMEIGTSKQAKRDFVALDTQPLVTGDVPGRFFYLRLRYRQ